MNIDVPTIKFTFQYIAIIRINLISFFTQFPNHLRLASVNRNTEELRDILFLCERNRA